MPGDEEAEHGLLACQPVVFAPGGHLREGGRGAGNRCLLAEEGVLAGLSLLLAYLGLGEGGVERRDELGPLPPAVSRERVTGAGVDERLEHALVAEP